MEPRGDLRWKRPLGPQSPAILLNSPVPSLTGVTRAVCCRGPRGRMRFLFLNTVVVQLRVIYRLRLAALLSPSTSVGRTEALFLPQSSFCSIYYQKGSLEGDSESAQQAWGRQLHLIPRFSLIAGFMASETSSRAGTYQQLLGDGGAVGSAPVAQEMFLFVQIVPKIRRRAVGFGAEQEQEISLRARCAKCSTWGFYGSGGCGSVMGVHRSGAG